MRTLARITVAAIFSFCASYAPAQPSGGAFAIRKVDVFDGSILTLCPPKYGGCAKTEKDTHDQRTEPWSANDHCFSH